MVGLCGGRPVVCRLLTKEHELALLYICSLLGVKCLLSLNKFFTLKVTSATHLFTMAAAYSFSYQLDLLLYGPVGEHSNSKRLSNNSTLIF